MMNTHDDDDALSLRLHRHDMCHQRSRVSMRAASAPNVLVPNDVSIAAAIAATISITISSRRGEFSISQKRLKPVPVHRRDTYMSYSLSSSSLPYA